MLSHAGLVKEFGTKVVNMACCLVISIICYRVENSRDSMVRKPIGYSALASIGMCCVYSLSNGKLEPVAKKCMFLGHAHRVRGYRL